MQALNASFSTHPALGLIGNNPLLLLLDCELVLVGVDELDELDELVSKDWLLGVLELLRLEVLVGVLEELD